MSIGSFFRKCFGLARDEPIEHASLHPANKPEQQMRGPEASGIFMDEHQMMTKPGLNLEDQLGRAVPTPVRYPLEGVQFLYSEFGDRLEFSAEPEWLDRAFGDKRITPIFLSEQHWFLSVVTGQGADRAITVIGPGDWIVYDFDRNELSINRTVRATPNDTREKGL